MREQKLGNDEVGGVPALQSSLSWLFPCSNAIGNHWLHSSSSICAGDSMSSVESKKKCISQQKGNLYLF